MNLQQLTVALQQAFAYLGWIKRKQQDPTTIEAAPPLSVIPPVEAPKMPQVASNAPTVLDLCLGIKEYEGWGAPGSTINGIHYPLGTPAWRHNSPGNCRISSVGYAPVYGHVYEDGGFAHFKDYATGLLYLQNLIKGKIKEHPYWTLYDLMFDYAPPKDNNNPTKYSQFLANRLKVGTDFPISQLK